uniref:Uncharacterized protein n=1 Tax=Rhizophora mucronata TaxID=61149 RepID=A0A2P2N8Z1_RHIMU
MKLFKPQYNMLANNHCSPKLQ